MTATKLSDLTDHGYDGRKRALAAKAGLSRDTLALSGGLVIDPATKAIAPNISMSVNNALVPGDGAFSADGIDDIRISGAKDIMGDQGTAAQPRARGASHRQAAAISPDSGPSQGQSRNTEAAFDPGKITLGSFERGGDLPFQPLHEAFEFFPLVF